MSICNKQLYTEFLKMYIDKTCLWDKRDLWYKRQDRRLQAIKELHEKYLEINKGATIAQMKNKIENMRTCCSKEGKKVLAAEARGETYKPTLWYFNILAPIYKDCIQDNTEDSVSSTSSNDGDDNESEIMFIEKFEYSEPEYIEPNSFSLEDNNDDDQRRSKSTAALSTRTAEPKEVPLQIKAFGRTMAAQLNEVDEYQRFIAEKLISDVVFNARVKKLAPDSFINI
ncbi:unnamed protein product [Leptidea sinapis]|uniref:MADF domain-containing protein n=1 Tax=Leptidea sinapis TaxID=189913 RepID=A0A5E4QXZ5_9NEOP|nr:unnamed protein product [Leptidea sinapis]